MTNRQHALMAKHPPISSSEWKIMSLLWAKSPQPAYDLIQSLSKEESWHPNTIRTLLSRLRKKGAIGVRKYKNLYMYYPELSEIDCVQAESDTFLNRVFGGSVKPLLIHFVKRQELPAADLAELRSILKEKKK